MQAFTIIATQTNTESEAHNLIANTLMNKICVPMKNLAETQLKARKPVKFFHCIFDLMFLFF
jgi:hypothetical protein